jgi:hypothetical protein
VPGLPRSARQHSPGALDERRRQQQPRPPGGEADHPSDAGTGQPEDTEDDPEATLRDAFSAARPYEEMDWPMQEAMLHAAAVALQRPPTV